MQGRAMALGGLGTKASFARRIAGVEWLPSRSACHRRTAARSATRPVAAGPASSSGGGPPPLADPSAGRRSVVAPQLDHSHLEDVQKAEAFGPRGVLLIGLSESDCQAAQRWFDQMEPGFVVSPCPSALLAGSSTLRQAVEGGSGDMLPERAWQAPPADAPPVAFFSGMSGEEQVAVMEGWREHTGLELPAFAAVTAGTLDKPLNKLLADIVRAQAQQPPPGYDPETVAEVQAAAAAAQGSGAAASSSRDSDSGSAAGAAGGGEQVLRSKLQDYVMLNTEGQTQSAPMSLDALKEQIQDKVRAKKAQQAAAEKRARKEGSQDETDRLRQALRSGKAGKKQQQGGRKPSPGGLSGKGFGG